MPKSEKQRKAEPQQESDQSQTLYVVLHGEFAIYEDRDNRRLRLFAPDIPAHAYMAGPWLGESHIPRGSRLTLFGVTEGCNGVTEKSGLFLRLPHTRPDPLGAYLEIALPFTDDILSGATQDLSGCTFTVNGKPFPPPSNKIAVFPVLKYTIDPAVETPYLHASHTNMQWPASGGVPGVQVLHIFAELDRPLSSGASTAHAKMAFHMGAELLGVQATVEFSGVGFCPETDPPDGLSVDEINMFLPQRLADQEGLGKQLQFAQSDASEEPTEVIWRQEATTSDGSQQGLLSSTTGSCGPVTS